MSALPDKPKKKRRIQPISLAPAVASTVPSAPPSAQVAPVAVPAPIAAPAPAPVPLETLDRFIQQSLQGLRDDVDGMLANSFVPDGSMLDELEACVKRVRGCVDRYNTAAEASERAAAAERQRLEAELKPVKIERTGITNALYTKYKAALSNEVRNLYRCPLACAATGVCNQGNPSRASNPAARARIQKHIMRWHVNRQDELREYRRADDWWGCTVDAEREGSGGSRAGA